MEATVAELLEEGELQRHVRKLRGVYRARRAALSVSIAGIAIPLVRWPAPKAVPKAAAEEDEPPSSGEVLGEV